MSPIACLAELPPPPTGRTGWPWTVETPPPEACAERPSWPRITIVTPSLNQAAFLEETIRSVLLQNYPNLQYIVIDGGSTDGSRPIIEKYAPWLDYWVSEPDQGQSDAINKGLARCDGEWFNWINSDDCLLPGALAAIASTAAGKPSIDIICGQELWGSTLAAAVNAGHTRLSENLETTFVQHRICQQGMFFRLAAVRAAGGVRTELHYVMDLDLLIRVLLREGLATARPLPVTLAFFRRHAAAKTHLVSPRFLQEERRLFHGLAASIGCDTELLHRIMPREKAAESIPAPACERLDRTRFAERLAQRFWWEGVVEDAWRRRDFTLFRRELVAFHKHFPRLGGARIARLMLLARLPDVLLSALSLLRKDGQDLPAEPIAP